MKAFVYSLIFIFLFLNFSLNSQISTELITDPNFVNGGDDLKVEIRVENKGAVSASLKWLISPSENCKTNWQFAGCDNIQCYVSGVFSNINPGSAPNEPFVLEAGEAWDFELHIYPGGVSGCCDISLSLSDASSPEVLLSWITVKVSSDDPECNNLVSNNDIFLSDLKLSPNPFKDIFNINKTSNIGQVLITNLLGKSVLHTRNVTYNYDLSHLPNGIYFASFYDIERRNTKIVKIVKE